MTTLSPLGWCLIHGGHVVRSGADLGQLRSDNRPRDIGKLLRGLLLIEPPAQPMAFPAMHLNDSVRRACEIIMSAEAGLGLTQRRFLATVYERALYEGYDGAGRPQQIKGSESLAADVVAFVASMGWRHGRVMKERWQAYGELASLLFGDRKPC